MEFNTGNVVVKRCIQGMDMEEKGNPEEAGKLFLQAWNEATEDFEKFIAAYYIARNKNNISDKLVWTETALMMIQLTVHSRLCIQTWLNVMKHLAIQIMQKNILNYPVLLQQIQLIKDPFITERKLICMLEIC